MWPQLIALLFMYDDKSDLGLLFPLESATVLNRLYHAKVQH